MWAMMQKLRISSGGVRARDRRPAGARRPAPGRVGDTGVMVPCAVTGLRSIAPCCAVRRDLLARNPLAAAKPRSPPGRHRRPRVAGRPSPATPPFDGVRRARRRARATTTTARSTVAYAPTHGRRTPTPARWCGPGCRTRRTRPVGQGPARWSSSAGPVDACPATTSPCSCCPAGAPRRPPLAARSGTGAWDAEGRASSVRLDRVLAGGAGRGTAGGRGAGPGPLRPGRRRGCPARHGWQ